MLDGGDIKRMMLVNRKDERLKLWKPGHNITYCPDENKMIDTTINSVAALNPELATTCKTRLISDAIDRDLQIAWDYSETRNGNPNVFVKQNPSLDGTIQFAPITQRTGSRARTSRIFCMSRHP
jgi:hypothetical protein